MEEKSDKEVDFGTDRKLSKSVVELNNRLYWDLTKFDWKTRLEYRFPYHEIKNTDIKDLLTKSAKEMRAIEFHMKNIVLENTNSIENQIKLRVCTTVEIQKYRER